MLFLTPDIGMIGYAFGNKVGAFSYNFFHHKSLAIGLYLVGVYFQNDILMLAGTIFFAHAAFDRILGYGLKYEKGFEFTHLGGL